MLLQQNLTTEKSKIMQHIEQSMQHQINSISNMSISQIKELPLFKYVPYSKLYQKALDKCIQKQPTLAISEVQFNLLFKTNIGECINIVSNTTHWNTSNSLKLEWNEGHVWKISMPSSTMSTLFEYKYLLVNEKGSCVKWEGGANKKIELNSIVKELNSHAGNIDQLIEINSNGIQYKYKNGLLMMMDTWQN